MYENNVALRSPLQIGRLRNSFCHFASHLSVKIEIVLLDQMVLHIIFLNEKLRGRNFYFRFLTV